MTVQLVVTFLFLVTILFWSYRRCRRALHLLQLDSYSNARLIKWYRDSPRERLFQQELLIFGGVALALSLFGVHSLTLLLGAGGAIGLLLREKLPQEKKPLVLTGRATRILAVGVLLSGLALLLLAKSIGFLLSAFLILFAAPLFIIGANSLLVPVQFAINKGYLLRAAKRLREVNPIVIAITGSFGKTSTKYFLETLLSERFSVLKTPGSFNTLLGISRVINGELKPHHKIFIVEIGAYVRGDVIEKCRFIHPKLGLFTAIGPEHFERFKSMENIILTHKELLDSLPSDGVAVLNVANEHGAALASHSKQQRTLRYGGSEKNELWAEEVSVSPRGMGFRLVSTDGSSIMCQCELLGRQNIDNILGAALVAREMGLSLAEIERGIRKLRPAPHRLQIVSRGEVTVIDDSYNSNPDGARAALETLADFTSGRRVLITPGMVELGELHEEKNREFGMQAAKACDYVILVGPKQTKPIADGLSQAGFPSESLKIVRDLNEARLEMESYVKAGDVVLFENDLPDLYAE